MQGCSSVRSLKFAAGGAHIGFHDGRIAGHLLVRAFREDGPTRQYGDGVCDARDHIHVVFNHKDGSAFTDFLDELRDAVHIFVAHALCRFVQQHEFRLHSQCGGDLKRAFAAIRKIDGDFVSEVFQIDFLKQFEGATVELVEHLVAAPEVERHARSALQADTHVLKDCQLREYSGDLKRTDDASTRDIGRGFLGDFHSVKENASCRRGEELCQQVEASRLACAVWSYEGMNGSAAYFKIYIVHGHETAEFLHEISCLEY